MLRHFVAAMVYLLIPGSALAGRPYLGFFFGVGAVTPTTEFYKRAGGGQTSTNQGLQPNTSVVRDASGNAAAWSLGLLGGYELFPLLAFQGRTKLEISSGGGGQHYFRGVPAVLGQEDASFGYNTANVDIGPRVCLGIVCGYAFVGLQTYSIYRFTFGSNGSYSDDDAAMRRVMGAQALLHIPVGANKIPAFDIGVEYETYPSSLGGNTTLWLLTFGMDFSLTKASK